MAVKHVVAVVGVVGALLLVCGLPMLLVPSQRARDVQRYNDAAIQLMEHPPLAFVPSERQARGLDPRVVGTVTTGKSSAKLKIVEDPGSASRAGDGPWGTVVGARWWLTAELNYTITHTVREDIEYPGLLFDRFETVLDTGLTFAFGNRTFHRAFPFQALSHARVPIACTYSSCKGRFFECLDIGMRRCTRDSLLSACEASGWTNYSGVDECISGDICGACTEYVYPNVLCTVVDVDGLEVTPSATMESCYYPFDTTPNTWRTVGGQSMYSRGFIRYYDTRRNLRVVVLPSTDPTLVAERLTKGRSFGAYTDRRRSVGLAFVIAGAVILVLDVLFALLRRLRLRGQDEMVTRPLPKDSG